MSTRVLNAYVTTASLHEVHAALRHLRAKLRLLTFREADKKFCGQVQPKAAPQPVGPLCDLDNLTSLLKGVRDRRQVAYNTTSSVVVYAHPVAAEGILVQFFGLNVSDAIFMQQTAAVKKFKGRDFHYQNFEDAPVGIAEAEWEYRGKIWGQVLPGPGIPSHEGFRYKLLDEEDVYEILITEFFRKNPAKDPESERTMDASALGAVYAGRFASIPEHDVALLEEWQYTVRGFFHATAKPCAPKKKAVKAKK